MLHQFIMEKEEKCEFLNQDFFRIDRFIKCAAIHKKGWTNLCNVNLLHDRETINFSNKDLQIQRFLLKKE